MVRPSWTHRGLLAVVAVVVVAIGAVAPAPGSGTVCAAAAGQTRVAVVVDFGTVADAPVSTPVTVCVAVDARTTGSVVLAERARLLGTPPPRYDPGSGLLCAIDGFPATGCGERTSTGYRYWSYHLGDTGAWRRADIGPATRRVGDASVEGWRFVEGRGDASDPPPRPAPDHTRICPPPPTTTTSTTSPTTAVPPGTSSTPTTVTPPQAPPGGSDAAPSSTAPGADGGVEPTVDGSPQEGPSDGTDADLTEEGGGGRDLGDEDDGSGGDNGDNGESASGGELDADELAAAAALRQAAPESGGSVLGLVAGAMLLGGLAAGAWWQGRRRGVA